MGCPPRYRPSSRASTTASATCAQKSLISSEAVAKVEKQQGGPDPISASAFLQMARESPWIYSATVGKRCKQDSDCGAPEFWCPNGKLKYTGIYKKCEVA